MTNQNSQLMLLQYLRREYMKWSENCVVVRGMMCDVFIYDNLNSNEGGMAWNVDGI